MTTSTKIEKAKQAGYYIEDMGKEYGKCFEGQYRWMNKLNHDDFQDAYTSDSVEEAWEELFSAHSL